MVIGWNIEKKRKKDRKKTLKEELALTDEVINIYYVMVKMLVVQHMLIYSQ